jgi:hypothetical protein
LDIAIYLEATPGVDSDLFLKKKDLPTAVAAERRVEVEPEAELELLRVQLKFHKQ